MSVSLESETILISAEISSSLLKRLWVGLLGHLLACLFYRIEGICQLRGVAPELFLCWAGTREDASWCSYCPPQPSSSTPPHSLIIGHSMFTQNGGVDKDWVACVAHCSVTTFKESRPFLSKRNSIRRFFNKILQYLWYVLKKGKKWQLLNFLENPPS